MGPMHLHIDLVFDLPGHVVGHDLEELVLSYEDDVGPMHYAAYLPSLVEEVAWRHHPNGEAKLAHRLQALPPLMLRCATGAKHGRLELPTHVVCSLILVFGK